MSIAAKILDHKNIYEALNRVVPPYRLTCSEHKELCHHANELNRICGLPKNHGVIKEFYGVQIELVVIIDDIN